MDECGGGGGRMIPTDFPGANSFRDLRERTMKEESNNTKPKQRSTDLCMTMAFHEKETQLAKPDILLHEAARTNNVEVVKRLLAAKVNINSANNLDRTPLQWAAANGSKEVIRVLLEHGADLEASDKYGMKAILWAAWFGQMESLRFLVACGADTLSVNKQGYGLLHCAANQNQCDVIQFIFEQLENFNLSDTDKQGRTAVHLSAREGHVEALSLLLTKVSNIESKEKTGKTALHMASAGGHLGCVMKLLEVGLDIDDRDEDGCTALHLCAGNNHSEVCEYLLEHKADANSETLKEMTALSIAASMGHDDVVSILLRHGCNPNSPNFQGNSPVHLAAMGGFRSIVSELVANGGDIDLPNLRSLTPLHAAVEKGNSQTVEELLYHGANTEAMENCGRSPLYMAARGSFTDIVDMIISAERKHKKTHTLHDCPDGNESDLMDSNEELPGPRDKLNSHLELMKPILHRLAYKQLGKNDWKKLAVCWKFNEAHMRAIQHQYTGEDSYKEHGYRMMMIWLHDIKPTSTPLKDLYDALVKIGKKNIAEQIRRKVESESTGGNTQKPNCRIH